MTEPGLVERLVALVTEILAPRRRGAPAARPKTLLAYRTSRPGRQLATVAYTFAEGSVARLEILGEGQLFIAFGEHPDTIKR